MQLLNWDAISNLYTPKNCTFDSFAQALAVRHLWLFLPFPWVKVWWTTLQVAVCFINESVGVYGKELGYLVHTTLPCRERSTKYLSVFKKIISIQLATPIKSCLPYCHFWWRHLFMGERFGGRWVWIFRGENDCCLRVWECSDRTPQ